MLCCGQLLHIGPARCCCRRLGVSVRFEGTDVHEIPCPSCASGYDGIGYVGRRESGGLETQRVKNAGMQEIVEGCCCDIF